MIVKFLIQNLLFLILFSVVSCGSSGGSGLPGKEEVETPPDASLAGESTLRGRVFLSDSDTPAFNYEIWMLDHTAHTFSRKLVSDTGAFSFPLNYFTEGSTYSMELVDKHGYRLGSFDVSSELNGLQSGFEYSNSGFGASIGDVTIPLDAFGSTDQSALTITASLAGGFSPVLGDYTISEWEAADDIESFSIGTFLQVEDPLVAKNFFYQRSTYPSGYQYHLGENSGVLFGLELSSGAELDFVQVQSVGDYLRSAKVFDLETSSYISWYRSGYKLVNSSSSAASAQIKIGKNLRAGYSASFSVMPLGAETLMVPVVLGYGFSMIPKIDQITINGAAASIVDYASASVENGLTKPFTWATGDVTVSVIPPLDEDGVIIHSDVLADVEMKFQYYTENTDGSLTSLELTGSSFASPYDASGELSGTSQMEISWDVPTLTLKHELIAVNTQALNAISFTIDSKILAFSEAEVDKVSVEILFTDGDGENRSSVVVWLKR